MEGTQIIGGDEEEPMEFQNQHFLDFSLKNNLSSSIPYSHYWKPFSYFSLL
jgi:hypothetical protein